MLIISYCNIIILGEELIYILIVCINKAEFCNGRDRPIKRVNIGYGFVNCVKLSYFQSLLYWFERTIKFSTVVTTIVIYIQREILHPTGHGTHNVYILSMFSLCQCCPCTSVFLCVNCYPCANVFFHCGLCVNAAVMPLLLLCHCCPCANVLLVSRLSLCQCCYNVNPVLVPIFSLCQSCPCINVATLSVLSCTNVLIVSNCPCANVVTVSV